MTIVFYGHACSTVQWLDECATSGLSPAQFNFLKIREHAFDYKCPKSKASYLLTLHGYTHQFLFFYFLLYGAHLNIHVFLE